MALSSLTLRSPLAESVVGVAVFGSYGRGDFDSHSDLDLLVVVRDGSGTTSEGEVVDAIRSVLPKQPSISFYGERKLRALFQEGNLFAWHLFFEAREIPGLPEPVGMFGRPNSYSTAEEDIEGLISILEGVSAQIAKTPQNAVFELGIVYVCARNIAMSASWKIKGRPDFSRYSPFGLPSHFPLSRELYETTMKCRMASTRGEEPPRVRPQEVEEVSEMLGAWARSVSDMVRKSDDVTGTTFPGSDKH